MKRNKGALAIEYAVLIAAVVVALLTMQGYTRRAICGRWRDAADTFGFGRQYEPGLTKIRSLNLIREPLPVVEDPIYSAFEIAEIRGSSPSIQIGVIIPCDVAEFKIAIWHISDDGQSATRVKELTRECDRGASVYYTAWDGKTQDQWGNTYYVIDGTYNFEIKFSYEGKEYRKNQRMVKQGLFWSDWTGN